MGENYRSCGNLAWSDPEHRLLHEVRVNESVVRLTVRLGQLGCPLKSPENLTFLLGLHDLTFVSVVE